MKIDFARHLVTDFIGFRPADSHEKISDALDNADFLIFKLYYDGCVSLFAARKDEKRIDGCTTFYIGDVRAGTSAVISKSKTAQSWLDGSRGSLYVYLEGFLPAKELDAFKEELFMELVLNGYHIANLS